MKRPLNLSRLVCLLALLWPAMAQAELAVIVHPESPIQTMSPRQVSDLYLGRSRSLSVGMHYQLAMTIYDLPKDSALRELFFQSLNGMGIKQVNAYWARLRFSGEVLPPRSLENSKAVVATVSRDKNAIGYIDSANVDDAVKVVLRLK